MSLRYDFKIIVTLFVVLYSIITLLFFNFYRELAMKDARQESIFILDTMNAIRDYISSVQRPLIEELKEKKLLDDEFFDPRLLSASYITREIHNIQLQKRKINYSYKLVASNPMNPLHVGTEFENGILEQFKEGKIEEYSKIIEENDTNYFFVSLPISSSNPACMQCHTPQNAPKSMRETYTKIQSFDENRSNIMAMLSIKIPVRSILTYHVQEFVVGGLAMFAVFVVFILLIYNIYKKDKRLQENTRMLLISQNRLASMGEMIANISHQWKQPLTQISTILINLELHSERNKLTPEKLVSKLKDANEQIAFMSSTIEDFKNFFIPNTKKQEFNAQEVIEHAIKLLRASLQKYSIKITVEIVDNFNHSGIANEIVQVLVNLINNAKEAFLANNVSTKEIQIKSLLDEKGSPMILVENNAGRIDASIIDKIFDPYFTTKNSSTGLGLYMSKMIIEKHHGTLKVQNTADGVIFIIHF